ncbi:phage head morphogenesis protein [Streptococcus thoraltensis]|uniref:phage head morphogenesis protein n=1 Tax=Streptococcus thoraltensis TaxID=55085 RepID=UPI00035C9C30|nr:phage head morphogenesis protein [Streptococcus thoraltensis]QBX31117.1 hypothetical protein Javan616_0024 [Streptococcus phage Javan616]
MSMKRLDYWQNRIVDILRYVDQTDFDFFAELTKLYADESAQIQKELYAFYGLYANENGLAVERAMERLRNEDLSDYQSNAQKYFKQAEKDPELLERLNEQYTSAKATRLEMLNLELTYRIGILNSKLQKSFGSYLKGVAKYAYRKAMGGHAVGINTPAIEELARTPINGRNYSEDLWKHTDNLAKDLKETLRRGFIRGENPRTMAQAIASKYNVAKSRAQTLVRTDGTAVIANSVARRYQDAGLKYYRIMVHLDERTTETCRAIAEEDKRYELSEFKAGVTAPPFHYNCRSGIIPDDDELDAASLDSVEEKSYNQGMKGSGAISSKRGDIKKQQDEFAERYYNQLRNSKRNLVVSKISKRSGVNKETVYTALEHILDNQYMLWDSEEFEYRMRTFYPHYDMALSLQRLMIGDIVENDTTMLKHEALEHYYMNVFKMAYDDAHKLANQKYNYEEGD